MSDVLEVAYQVGSEYRISRLLALDHQVRNRYIACGLIPGAVIKISHRMFRGTYWVIQVHNQRLGLRRSELKQLQLYDIETN